MRQNASEMRQSVSNMSECKRIILEFITDAKKYQYFQVKL